MAVSEDTTVARRTILKGLAAVPLIGGAFAAMIGRADAFDPTDPRILRAYSNWLYYERKFLCMDMYPSWGPDADAAIPVNTGADCYHRPRFGNWADADFGSDEPPAARATLVLTAVEIDPRRAIERGLL